MDCCWTIMPRLNHHDGKLIECILPRNHDPEFCMGIKNRGRTRQMIKWGEDGSGCDDNCEYCMKCFVYEEITLREGLLELYNSIHGTNKSIQE